MNNFNNMIKQAQELQQKMADAQQKVETLEAEGVAGGGTFMSSVVLHAYRSNMYICYLSRSMDEKMLDICCSSSVDS